MTHLNHNNDITVVVVLAVVFGVVVVITIVVLVKRGIEKRKVTNICRRQGNLNNNTHDQSEADTLKESQV